MELLPIGRFQGTMPTTRGLERTSPPPEDGRTGGFSPSQTGAMPPVQGAAKDTGGQGAKNATADSGECQTCKNRTYQDGSDDPGVSYQTPTTISADEASSAVRAHEMEHVTREQFDALQEGRKVVSQSVTIHSAICPDCGRVYVSGGTTRTVTKGQEAQLFQAGSLQEPKSGNYLDAVV